jgi:hypothetical protein
VRLDQSFKRGQQTGVGDRQRLAAGSWNPDPPGRQRVPGQLGDSACDGGRTGARSGRHQRDPAMAMRRPRRPGKSDGAAHRDEEGTDRTSPSKPQLKPERPYAQSHLSVPPTPVHRAVIEIQTPGKIDNCQIGVLAAYATSSSRALVDRDLYLPKAWTSDRDRCRAAKIPDERGFATKGELAWDTVRRCIAAGLPATWVTTDEAYGQAWHFRRLLEQLGLGYVVAVPKSQQIKSLAGIYRIDQLIEDAPADAWQRLSCGRRQGPARLRLGRGQAARQPDLRPRSADSSPLGDGPP